MKTPTRAELEKMSYDELDELASELAEEDEEIKTIRHYFIDEFWKRMPEKAILPSDLGDGEMIGVSLEGTPVLWAKVEGKMKETKERIMKLTGKSFDQAFVKQMVDDHTSTIKAFEDESKKGTDTDLKSWVDKTLPTLRDHLKMAKDLQKKLK